MANTYINKIIPSGAYQIDNRATVGTQSRALSVSIVDGPTVNPVSGVRVNTELPIFAESGSLNGYQLLSEKDQPSGYPGLDANGAITGTIIHRKGTESELSTVVLSAGEWGYATDTGKTAIGDGSTTFANLGSPPLNIEPDASWMVQDIQIFRAGNDDIGAYDESSIALVWDSANFRYKFQTVAGNTLGLLVDSLYVGDIHFTGNGSINNPFSIEDVQNIKIKERTSTPPAPASGTQANIYIRNDNLVIQFNDAGTTRYKYIPLSGTSVTWTHSTTAP